MENKGMMASELINYSMMILIPTGIVVGLIFWLRNLLEDVGTKITGIWANSDQTFRVLIYDIDSIFQGEVIWTNTENQRILGRSILQGVRLKFALFGKGNYICPFTRREYSFRLRRLSKESLQFYMTDTEGKVVANETWNLVSR
ncbi:MAG TPA: hypothetical protein VIT44_12295 [Cyclobacteriaceae bacterium]